MKNQLIRDRYAALTVLSQRVLPSATAIHKVSALLGTRFKLPYDATEVARKTIIADHPTPEGWEKESLPPTIAEARQRAIDALMEEATPVRKIPDTLRLTSADLPKVLKREGGESNTEGLAQIVVLLGTLYVPSSDERALNAAAEGEEPDEAPPEIPVDDFAPLEA